MICRLILLFIDGVVYENELFLFQNKVKLFFELFGELLNYGAFIHTHTSLAIPFTGFVMSEPREDQQSVVKKLFSKHVAEQLYGVL